MSSWWFEPPMSVTIQPLHLMGLACSRHSPFPRCLSRNNTSLKCERWSNYEPTCCTMSADEPTGQGLKYLGLSPKSDFKEGWIPFLDILLLSWKAKTSQEIFLPRVAICWANATKAIYLKKWKKGCNWKNSLEKNAAIKSGSRETCHKVGRKHDYVCLFPFKSSFGTWPNGCCRSACVQ